MFFVVWDNEMFRQMAGVKNVIHVIITVAIIFSKI